MQKTVKFRAGLVDAGYISDYHIAALRRIPNVDIVGIFDIDIARANVMAAKYDTTAFASLTDLYRAGANVIHVLTPPATHAAVAMESLELGCHVLVEKPLATDVLDCRKIRLKAQEMHLRVCVNHSLLFDPQVRRALEMARSGKLGQVVSVDILRSSQYPPFDGGPMPPQYRTAGYPFRDLGVHALYLFEAFLGPIADVRADWMSLGGDPNLAFDEWRALVRCRDGLGQFQLSWNDRPLQSQLVIHGTKGILRVDLFLMYHVLRASTPFPKAAERILNAMSESFQPLWQVPLNVARFVMGRIRPYHGLGDLVAAFYQSLAAGSEVPVPVADAETVVNWTEYIARAADQNQADRLARLVPLKKADVLVTGASGALGTAIVDRLRADGRRVRVLVRRVPDDISDDIEVSLGDLGDPVAVDRAVDGVRSVIHCGAAMKGGWPEHLRGTVVGTQNVLNACRKHGIEKLVYISSLSVVDWAGGGVGEAIVENSPFEPHPDLRGSYTRAKLEAEQIVGRFTREFEMQTVILRPGQIFGGKIPLLTPAVARKIGKCWLVLGNGDLQLPLVHMDDVVDGIVAALDRSLPNGEVIQLVDNKGRTQNDVLRQQLPNIKVIHMPRVAVYCLGMLSEFVFALLRRSSPVSLYRLRSALARRTFKSEHAFELLGWRPRGLGQMKLTPLSEESKSQIRAIVSNQSD